MGYGVAARGVASDMMSTIGNAGAAYFGAALEFICKTVIRQLIFFSMVIGVGSVLLGVVSYICINQTLWINKKLKQIADKIWINKTLKQIAEDNKGNDLKENIVHLTEMDHPEQHIVHLTEMDPEQLLEQQFLDVCTSIDKRKRKSKRLFWVKITGGHNALSIPLNTTHVMRSARADTLKCAEALTVERDCPGKINGGNRRQLGMSHAHSPSFLYPSAAVITANTRRAYISTTTQLLL